MSTTSLVTRLARPSQFRIKKTMNERIERKDLFALFTNLT